MAERRSSATETVTIGTTIYTVAMSTFVATLTGPRGATYTAVENIRSGTWSVITGSGRPLTVGGRVVRMRRHGNQFEVLGPAGPHSR
ncbi:hypothetical protein DFR74_1298 [Nocardia puris]|uniref:Uncharacterized protein n=2 Tax=Nocardia puris TaxID=208602 RepID=A0A366CW81_9NOCA|nr:hypothetical protein DFR74_1298 [Nocardia puris]